VVTNRFLLVVGCWGQKETVLTCYDMTPLLLLPPPPTIFDQCAIISEEAFGQIEEPPPTSCTMQDEWFCENRNRIRLGWMWFW
jgi:hypothetical protein